MNIKDVKTATKLGDFVLRPNHRNNKNSTNPRAKAHGICRAVFGTENCRTKVRGIKPTIFNNKIGINYLANAGKETLSDETPRVYLFVQDGIIKKIGGSSGEGGIKATMNFYVFAMTGSPGVPRFVIHLLIAEALEEGSKVELFMITSPKVPATINGLFGSKQVEIASFKEMEDFCKSDYFSKENRYPDWNFQENHESYPTRLAQQHNLYHQNRLKK